jgi:hypothetical protein
MAINIGSLQIALAQMPANTGGFDFSILTQAGAPGGTMSGMPPKVAIEQAEKNEAKQLAQTAKDPQVKREVARYEKVVKSAKTIDDVLDDPIARKVLMTAAGLGAYVDQVGLAKKAMLSDPDDPNSLAAKLSATNSGWLQFARDYNIAKYGLDRLSPKRDGFAGRWRLDIEREGEPLEAVLEIGKTSAVAWQAKVNGVVVPATINGSGIMLTLFWEDSSEHIHTSYLTGTLGRDGTVEGPQSDDGKASTNNWSADPYFAGSIKEVRENYIAEKRLDMLDQQMPGLGTALLFKKAAKNFDTPIKILGSPLGREVVTTALGLPKQLAVQSLNAQEKALTQRIDPAKLKDPEFADRIAQRYLIMLNGGIGGITV